MLIPTLFPVELVTRDKPYVTLASMWSGFSNLKHTTSPAIDGGVCAYVPQALSPHASSNTAPWATPVAAAQRRRPGREIPFRWITASGASMISIT